MPRKFWRFHLSGHLCLDFANTVSWRASSRPIERIERAEDLVRWARQARVIRDREASQLVEQARRRPAEAALAVARAYVLREAIYQVFSTLADRRAPDRAALARINSVLSDAMHHLRVTRRAGGRFIWAWESEPSTWNRLLWPVAQSAAEVLTSDNLGRLKKCPSSNCGWVFLDTSRNGTRRWCDMKVCGNRAKALRYYARHRSTRLPRSSGRSSVRDLRST
jgi:predicted RNA-binding Zn ribbon-like protein